MLGTHYPGGFAQYLALPPEILARVPLNGIVKGMEMVQKGEALKVIVDPWM